VAAAAAVRGNGEGDRQAPRVSVGLPVYEGEAYLEEAIRSVLGQGFGDLELVVVDNASADRTPEIAQDLAASDPRVRYHRNPRNLGAAPNYNRAFALSTGALFKWLAHDDRLLPGYLGAAVAALDARPEAVLAHSAVEFVDARGAPLARHDSGLAAADHPDPARRFAAMALRSHACVDFFGLIRRGALAGSLLHASFHGADRALLAQLALRGPLLRVPGPPLAQVREHPGRYTRRGGGDARARRRWHDADGAGAGARAALPSLELWRTYRRLVAQEPGLDAAARRRCRAALRRWWLVNWNLARVGADALGLLAPGAVGRAERLKARLWGAAPGHFARR
jgi:glycosyltransferase involved in cell wall biosynthesis